MSKASKQAIITFLSDFGNKDGYAGIVKGVILSICPQAQIIDLSHEIASGDVPAAAWVINNAYPYFPPTSVHLVVVDPGVGSSQRRIALSNGEHTFIGPDNGVFSLLLEKGDDWQAFALTNQQYFLRTISTTFHGRDIFGPVAAHLHNGVIHESLGDPIEIKDLTRLAASPLAKKGSTISGAVVYIDKFGNLITNISGRDAQSVTRCLLKGKHVASLGHTYSSAPSGQTTAFIGSHGFIEIAVNSGSAARVLGAGIGDPVRLEPE